MNVYRQSKPASVDLFETKFNQKIAKEIKDLMYRFNNEGRLDKFDEIVPLKGVLCEKIGPGEYSLKQVFK